MPDTKDKLLHKKLLLSLAAAALACSLTVTPAFAQSGLGAFLAARHADRLNDFEKAAEFYTQALANNPGNPQLIENALAAQVNKGDVARAVAMAEVLATHDGASQLASWC